MQEPRTGLTSDETRLASSSLPRRLGHYQVEREIGRGGMGQVYLARDESLDRAVAIKVLPAEIATDEERRKRFEREARLIARLNHANIATVYELGEEDGRLFLALEYIEGRTLHDILREQTKVDLDTAFDYLEQMLAGLKAAHDQGIVHRDLKPGNIMLTGDGVVKLLDFGLAKLLSGPSDHTQPQLTNTGAMLGTPEYMSPEQARGKPVDERSDLYSIGVILHELLTGTTPFRRSSQAETISAILNDDPPSLETIDTAIPSKVASLVRRLLAKSPADRPASARFVLDELTKFKESGSRQPVETVDDSAKPKSIAVLPLENLSGDPTQEYFADGMTDALITDLARIDGLRVISRTTVMAYKGRHESIRDLARELNVDYLVEGTVVHADERVRITAQLIRAETDDHLWADRYDRDLRDVLALQSEVAQRIAEAVNVVVKPHQQPDPTAAPKIDPEAYLLSLKGQLQLNLRNEASFLKAMRLFEQVIAIDPTYAPAHAGLADCYNMLINYGLMPISEGIAAARAAIESALKLDPDLAGAQRALAQCQWQAEFNWIAAEGTYQRAIERDPNSATTLHWYGAFLGVCGRFLSSQQWLRRALELDPLSLNIRCIYGWMLYFAQRFEESIPHYRRALKIDPDHLLAHWFLGQALVEIGEHEEAIVMLRRASELLSGTSRSLGYLGYALGRGGQRDDALQLLSQLDQRARADYVPPYAYALIHCGLGQVEEAIGWLQKAADLPDSLIRDLLVDPPLECVRADPRYQDLLKQINLAGISERPVDPPA